MGKQPIDDAHAEIGPYHEATGSYDVAIVDHHSIRLHEHIGKPGTEVLGKQPVRGRGTAGEKSG